MALFELPLPIRFKVQRPSNPFLETSRLYFIAFLVIGKYVSSLTPPLLRLGDCIHGAVGIWASEGINTMRGTGEVLPWHVSLLNDLYLGGNP